MKILMTTDTAGGVWSYSTSLSLALSKFGIKTLVAASGPPLNRGQKKDIIQLKKKGIEFHFKELKLEWMENSEEDIENASIWIRKLVDKFSPDLIHFNNYGQAILDWKVPTVLVAHSCVASWWKAVKHSRLPDYLEGYFKMVNQAFENANVVVSPTKAILNDYQRFYGLKDNQVVIPNGVEPPSNPIITPKKDFIFSAGRIWDEAKNLSLLLDAAEDINAEIFIAGSGSENHPSIKNVTFLGELSREQVANWMRMAKVYAMPVKYEPFGLSFLEAAYYSTALIGGDIDTLHEIWDDAMVYTCPDDKKEFSEICNELIADDSKTNELAYKAYMRAQHYSLDTMAERYHELYNSIQQHA
jgi:glycogen synthase